MPSLPPPLEEAATAAADAVVTRKPHRAVRILDAVPSRPDLNNGGKAYLPEQMLMCCLAAAAAGNDSLDAAMIFKLEREGSGGCQIHVGVVEFTAEAGTICLPEWILDKLKNGDEEETKVLVSLVNLPKAQKLLVAPLSDTFMKLDHKVVLENRLRLFSALTRGDVIPIEFNGQVHRLRVLECRSDDVTGRRDDVTGTEAVDITECNVEIDFAAAENASDVIKHEEEEGEKNRPDFSWTLGTLTFAADRGFAAEKKKKADDDQEESQKDKQQPKEDKLFPGKGRRLE